MKNDKFYEVRPYYNAWLQFNKRAKRRDEERLTYTEYLSEVKGLKPEEIKQIENDILENKVTSPKPKSVYQPKTTVRMRMRLDLKLSPEETAKVLQKVQETYGSATKMNIERYKEDLVCQLRTLI